MRIFVAGATGVLGHRAVVQLLATGAEVTGMARTADKQDALRRLGAPPALVSLFDRDALLTAVAGHDVVCNLTTAIPTGERAATPASWAGNDRIRREVVVLVLGRRSTGSGAHDDLGLRATGTRPAESGELTTAGRRSR